jgi:hypothetical protein
MTDYEVLGEEVIWQNGPHRRVRRWLRGCHPHLGPLHLGWSGWETVVEVDLLRPTGTFRVEE